MIYAAEMNDGIYRWFDPDTGYGGYVDNLLWFNNPHVAEGVFFVDELERIRQSK